MVTELKNFLVKDEDYFKLRVRVRDQLAPADLRNVEFIGEQWDNGKMIDSSTYQFFLTDEEIAFLCQQLMP
jgi:hypothetical protein